MMVLVVVGVVALVYAIQGSHWPRLAGRRSTLTGGDWEQGQVSGRDPLVVLRERYAAGEIDQEEFERRVETLLRTDPTQDRPLP
jgi:uncharacterized membrane protein